jgi:hypothetical protein
MASLDRILRVQVSIKGPIAGQRDRPLGDDNSVRRQIELLYSSGVGNALHRMLHVTMPSKDYF